MVHELEVLGADSGKYSGRCYGVCNELTLGIPQAADVWEEATPHTYLNEIVRQMLLIV